LHDAHSTVLISGQKDLNLVYVSWLPVDFNKYF